MGAGKTSPVGNILEVVAAQDAHRETLHPGQNLRRLASMQAIFAITDIPNVVVSILDQPVLAEQMQQGVRRRLRWRQTSDKGQLLFLPFLCWTPALSAPDPADPALRATNPTRARERPSDLVRKSPTVPIPPGASRTFRVCWRPPGMFLQNR